MLSAYTEPMYLPGANLVCTPPRTALNLTAVALLALLLLTQQVEDSCALLPRSAALQLSRCCILAKAIQLHNKPYVREPVAMQYPVCVVLLQLFSRAHRLLLQLGALLYGYST
jgi:hypothetical protein